MANWRVRDRRSATISTVVLGAFACAVGLLAFLHRGVPTAEVNLNDGSVWLTNQSLLWVGHLNHSSLVLDGGARPATSDFDILQSGYTLVVHDRANSSVEPLDAAYRTLGSPIPMPAGSLVSLGGDTVGIVDPSDGRLWVVRADQLQGLDLSKQEPVATIGAGAAVAVGPDGVARAVSTETGSVTEVALDARGDPLEATTTNVVEGDHGPLTITSVGSDAVVLDADNGVLYFAGRTAHVPDNGTALLQQPSAASSTVAVATETSLILQPLDGSDPTVTDLASRGTPAAPVYLLGCTYGAWAGSGQFIRDCVGDDFDVQVPIDGALPSAAFAFRVNRDIVVLNDYVNGPGWLASEGMERVDNWEELLPPEVPDPDPSNSPDPTPTDSILQRDEVNTPPVAEDDEYGVRAGHTTILPVVDNDYDYDGDVLTATVIDTGNVPGIIQRIRGGGALQVVVPASATGTMSFVYRIDDGRGGVDDATVTLSVIPEGSNGAPEPQRVSRLSLEAGATASYNVLPDWTDPDGDTLILSGVGSDSTDTIDFDPSGVVTVTANPEVLGTRDIPVVVSDGISETSAVLRVDVWPAGTRAPQANADRVVTTANRPVVVSPLSNDLSRSGLALRLTTVSESRGATVVPDHDAGTFSFVAPSPGTYYVVYQETDGPNTATGLVRIDVEAAFASEDPPIAVSDVALLPPGRDVLVDALVNDSDPGGGVLVVQTVDIGQARGIAVEILEHRLLRITNTAELSEPVTIKYTVSNGKLASVGDVTVIPVPAPEQILAPVAQDDDVLVRAGDVAKVDVLGNDYHPNGLSFELVGMAEPTVDAARAEVFAADGTVRIKAGDEPGLVKATYEIRDEQGQAAFASVNIRIVAADEGANVAPRPENVTARVLSGQSVRIPIKLDGIDPDGDSVTLVGLGDAPSLGRVVQVGQDWLVYEAYADGTGSDSFTYTVVDRLGAEATGTVTIGVAPPARVNSPPVAVPDSSEVRPQHSISVAVLANDSDPDADTIALVPDGLEVPEGIEASVANDRVLVVAGQPGEYTIEYAITDIYGALGHAAIQVTVDPDLPQLPPIARDDRALLDDVTDEGTVDVAVLDNDEDPDGVASALVVTVADMGDPLDPSAVVNPGWHRDGDARSCGAEPHVHDHRPGWTAGLRLHTRPRPRAGAPQDPRGLGNRGSQRRDGPDRRRRLCAHRERQPADCHDRRLRSRGPFERRPPGDRRVDARVHVGRGLLRQGRDHLRGHGWPDDRRPRRDSGDPHAPHQGAPRGKCPADLQERRARRHGGRRPCDARPRVARGGRQSRGRRSPDLRDLG